VAISRGNASIVCGVSYHVWDLPSVIICDDVVKDPSDCLSPLTSEKSYISKSRYLARYFPANIPWPMTAILAKLVFFTFPLRQIREGDFRATMVAVRNHSYRLGNATPNETKHAGVLCSYRVQVMFDALGLA